MVFYPPEWAPKLPIDPLDTVLVFDFFVDEKYSRPVSENSLDHLYLRHLRQNVHCDGAKTENGAT